MMGVKNFLMVKKFFMGKMDNKQKKVIASKNFAIHPKRR